MFKVLKYTFILLIILSCETLFSQATFYRRNLRKERAAVITVSGVVFTTTAILDNLNKGKWVNTANGRQYVYPNIITSFPQNIMLGAGISLTIGGLASFKRKY